MTLHSSGLLSYALDETVTESVFSGFMNNPLFMPALFSILPSSGPRETPSSFSELATFAQKPEGVAATPLAFNQEFKKTFTHVPYAAILNVTRELRDDDKVGVVAEMASQIGEAGAETIEEQVGLLFNNIENATYFTTEGGLAIASTAHLNASGGNQQSNLGALALDYTGIKTTRANMRRWKGYKSTTFKNIVGDELIVGPELEEDSWQIAQSMSRPGNANNDLNMYKGRFTLYVFHRLTSDTAWGMMASKERKKFLRFYNRTGLEVMSDESFSQQTQQIGAYMRFSMGTTDWRWIHWQSI